MTVESAGRRMSLRDILIFLFRHKGKIFGLLFACTGLTAVGAYLLPPSYEATSKVIVERTTPAVPDLFSPAYHVMELDEVINSEAAIITSRSVTETVVDSLGLVGRRKPPTFLDDLADRAGNALYASGLLFRMDKREAIVGHLMKKVDVEPVPQSDVIEIRYSTDDPELAAGIVNALTETYIARRQEIYGGGKASEIYENLLQSSQQELHRLGRESRKLKDEAGIVALDQQKALLLQEIEQQSAEIRRIELDHQEIENKLAELQNPSEFGLSAISRSVADRNNLIDEMGKRLLDLRLKLVELSQKSGREKLDVQNVQEEIKALQGRMRETLTSMLTTLAAQEKIATSQVRRDKERLQALNGKDVALSQLTLSTSAQEKAYLLYRDKVEEARFKEGDSHALINVKIIDRAAVPKTPRFSRLLFITLGAILGGVLGLTSALVREHFDHSFRDEEDVRARLNLPVLATIPFRRELARRRLGGRG